MKNPLDAISRQVPGVIGDVGRIAEATQTLPAVLESLQVIERRISSLDDEVKKMRVAVERLEDGVGPLETKLDEVARALHPLKRAFGRSPKTS
jgi:phage shock protein A